MYMKEEDEAYISCNKHKTFDKNISIIINYDYAKPFLTEYLILDVANVILEYINETRIFRLFNVPSLDGFHLHYQDYVMCLNTDAQIIKLLKLATYIGTWNTYPNPMEYPSSTSSISFTLNEEYDMTKTNNEVRMQFVFNNSFIIFIHDLEEWNRMLYTYKLFTNIYYNDIISDK